MTETELKDRLTASVEEIEAAPDVLTRVRYGGARRLRRRRLTALAVSTLAVVAVGGIALTGPGLYRSMTEPPVAGVPVQNDAYGFLMKGQTRGDLADDQDFLDQAVAAWQKSHRNSGNRDRGIFDHLQGEPQVYWAGRTAAGRVAIIGQYSDLRNHDNIQLDRQGVHTLVGFIADGKDGKPTVVADSYTAPGVSLATGFIAGDKALVVLDVGKKVGWSPARQYNDDGSSSRQYAPVQFKDGVGVVKLPQGTDPAKVALHTLPASGPSDQGIINAAENVQGVSTPENRLWPNVEGDGGWPMSPGADQLADTARDVFSATMRPATDAVYYVFADSLWTAYGVTADGSAVYAGEQQLDTDPAHVYAVLKPKTGKARIIHGGVPDRTAGLPVRIKLPNGQGWVVAAKGATLSYRYGDQGGWLGARQNALVVPDGDHAQVSVEINGTSQVVTLS